MRRKRLQIYQNHWVFRFQHICVNLFCENIFITDVQTVFEIKKIGVNINQLTKHINSLPLDEEIINSLSSIENFIAELKQIIDKLNDSRII